MKAFIGFFGLLAVFTALSATPAAGQLPFFSGAEGFGGSFSGTAPAGGWFSNATVYHVTRLDDDLGTDGKGAPGTLRGAFRENTSNKIIIFDVAGTINLTNGKLDIKNLSNYYIAGQTAPGPVTIYGDMTQLTHSSGKENRNVVLRYLSFRKGTGDNQDSITFAGSGLGTHLIFDHVSASWSEDEILSVANNNTNVTVQYSLIHDALVSNHAYGSLIRPQISSNVTFHHNLYAHNASRQARFGTYNAETLTADFRNNVVYNWRDRASYAGGSSESQREFADINFVGNYFIAGPGTVSNATRSFIVDKNITAQVYQAGNFVDSDRQLNPGGQPNGSDTGWNQFLVQTGGDKNGTLTQMPTPFNTPPVTTQTANDAYWQIINHVGNWWWDRDAIDSRVVGNVLSHQNAPNGIGASAPPAAELNGLLNAPIVSHPTDWDTDGDGMPDWWEQAHGLNPSAASDWHVDFDNDGYINLIEYINERGEFPAPAPIVFNGGTNNRYALITNWKTQDGVTAGSNWQPSKYDEAQINSGTVGVDSVGQHAGLLIVGANAGNTATLNITSGWLKVADALVIGGDDAATAAVNLSGGMLSAPMIAKGDGGTFNFTGGVLHAEVVGFDLYNQGGVFTPGHSVGEAHVMGDLVLDAGTLEIEIASTTVSDTLLVGGSATLGGNLEISLLGGFTPVEGQSWQILSANGGISGAFGSITSGYSLQPQGETLMLYFGNPPPVGLAGDFNGNGVVDAADYVLWRTNGGTADEYNVWRSNFGAVAGGGSFSTTSVASSVPEMATGWLAIFSAGIAVFSTRRPLRVCGCFLQK